MNPFPRHPNLSDLIQRLDASLREPRHRTKALLAAGTMHLLGATSEAKARLVRSSATSRSWIEGALGTIDVTALERASFTVLRVAPRVALMDAIEVSDQFRPPSVEEAWGALTQRTEIEVILVGASLAASSQVQLPSALQQALDAFEASVRPELWRLIPLAEMCAEGIQWMRPQFRKRFWWLSLLASMDPAGLAHLASAAAVLERFPEAMEELLRLRKAQRYLDAALAERNVVSLADWIRVRRSSSEVRAAVGFASGVTLLEREDLTLVWEPPDVLVLDLLVRSKPDAVPTLISVGQSELEATRVVGAVERFRWKIEEFETIGGCLLRIPFLSGPVEVNLPPNAVEPAE